MALTLVPNPGQSLSVTRNPIRNNFNLLNNGFVVDHAQWGTVNAGKHNTLHMPTQVNVTTVAGETALFTKLGPTSGRPELFYKPENSLPDVNEIPFTESIKAIPGWTYLPSGIQIFWGTGQTTGAPVTVNFASGGFDRECLSVVVTPTQTGTKNWFLVNTLTAASFVCESYDASQHESAVTFNYIAIGY